MEVIRNKVVVKFTPEEVEMLRKIGSMFESVEIAFDELQDTYDITDLQQIRHLDWEDLFDIASFIEKRNYSFELEDF